MEFIVERQLALDDHCFDSNRDDSGAKYRVWRLAQVVAMTANRPVLAKFGIAAKILIFLYQQYRVLFRIYERFVGTVNPQKCHRQTEPLS